MIKVEVVFDGDLIIFNGKQVGVFADYGYDTSVLISDNKDDSEIEKETETLEQAIAYCLEQSK